MYDCVPCIAHESHRSINLSQNLGQTVLSRLQKSKLKITSIQPSTLSMIFPTGTLLTCIQTDYKYEKGFHNYPIYLDIRSQNTKTTNESSNFIQNFNVSTVISLFSYMLRSCHSGVSDFNFKIIITFIYIFLNTAFAIVFKPKSLPLYIKSG